MPISLFSQLSSLEVLIRLYWMGFIFLNIRYCFLKNNHNLSGVIYLYLLSRDACQNIKNVKKMVK